MALTDIEIKKAKAKEQAYNMSDSGGLHICVTPAGRQTVALEVQV
jgi:hypothetical protein